MSLAERRGSNRSVTPDATRQEAEVSTTQDAATLPSAAVEFARITDYVDLALAAIIDINRP